MGANGGLCWVRIKDKTKLDRLEKLLSPFWGYQEYNDNKSENWERENEMKQSGELMGCLCGTYGDFQEFDSYDDLQRIVTEIKYNHNKHESMWPFQGLTWFEVIEEMETRPWNSFFFESQNEIDRCINWHFKSYGKDSKYDIPEELEKYKDILSMKLIDWADEIAEIIDISNVMTEETWT